MTSRLTRGLVLVAALAAAGLGVFLWLSGGFGRADTVVLVTVGGLRDDALESMPALQGMAEEGLSGSAWASIPMPVASATELMTGRDPAETEAFFEDTTLLAPSLSTLAERFSEAGYETAAFVGDGRLSLMTGLYRGFDQVTLPSNPFDQPILPAERARLRFPRSGHIQARGVVELAASYLQSRYPRARAFLWIHAGDPARALSAARSADEEREYYEVALGIVDESLAQLRDALERAGRARDAMVLVASLHGAAFGEGGERRYGLVPGEGTTRVPLVLLGAREDLPLPGRLRDLPGLVLEARGLEALGPSEESAAWRGSWVGSRTYSWAPRIERLEDGAWRATPEGEGVAPHGLGEGLHVPSAEERVALLDMMRQASNLARSGEGEAALAILERAAEDYPLAAAPPSLALSLLRAGAREGAEAAKLREEMFERFDTLSRGHPYARLDFARALQSFEDKRAVDVALRLSEEEGLPRGYRFALANVLASGDALEAAVAMAQEIASEYEASVVPELWEWIGDKLTRSGNAFRARQAYERAVGVPRARSALLLAKLADTHRSLGEDEEALRLYGEAVLADESYLYPHYQAAELFVEQERFNEAAHAVALSVPRSGDALADALARAKALEDRGLLRAAAAEVYEASRSATSDQRLLITLARLLVSAGDPTRAEEFASEALELKSDAPGAMIQLARARAALADPVGAREWLEKARPLCRPEGAVSVRRDPLFTGESADPRLAAYARDYASTRTGKP